MVGSERNLEQRLIIQGIQDCSLLPSLWYASVFRRSIPGIKTVKERSAVVRFKVVGEDAYFLAWTTTPWTLPSNVALCVNPKETYAKVKAADGYTYYMAEALLDTVLGKLADKENGTPAYRSSRLTQVRTLSTRSRAVIRLRS